MWDENLDKFSASRRQMVETQLRCRGIKDERLLDAMSKVPRQDFVDRDYAAQAYEDHPIAIGEGQTISQPYIVAATLAALELQPQDIVLEVGTGTGYQTAILATLVAHVYTVERHPALAAQAKTILSRLGFQNITLEIGDGSLGLAAFAPFDAIVVSAAAPRMPPALFEQLRQGGRMVLPVGPADSQSLLLVRKDNDAPVITTLERCRFVPLIGDQGFSI